MPRASCLALGLLATILANILPSVLLAATPLPPTTVYYLPEISGTSLPELASCGINVISHVPYEKEFVEAAHRAGIRVLIYTSLYKASNSNDWPCLQRHPFWRAVDAAKHPEWMLIREDGQVRRPFEAPLYCPGFEQSCCNHQNLTAAYVQGVKNVLDCGCDGIFIDNIHPYKLCYGEKLGLHTHQWPEKPNPECFAAALGQVFQTVQQRGPDRLCFINPGGIRRQWATYGHSMMQESFLYAEVESPGNLGRNSFRWRPSWDKFPKERAQDAEVERATAICAQTYLCEACSDDESAIFAFTGVKLLGPRMWAASISRWRSDWLGTLSRGDIVRRLYREHDLGKPLGEPILEVDRGYRQFERATVLVNPTNHEVTLDAPVDQLTGPLAELFSGTRLPVRQGKVQMVLPPETGRVVLAADAVLRNCLREVQGQLAACRAYLQQGVCRYEADRIRPDVLPLVSQLEEEAGRLLDRRGGLAPGELEAFAAGTARLNEDLLPQTAASLLRERRQTLDPTNIRRLLALKSGARLTAEIFTGNRTDAAILRSAGALHLVPAFGGRRYDSSSTLALVTFGEDAYDCLAWGPIGRAGAGGEDFIAPRNRHSLTVLVQPPPGAGRGAAWLAPWTMKNTRLVRNGDREKVVESQFTLAPVKSPASASDIRLDCRWELQAGSPLVHLSMKAVRPDGSLYPGEIRVQDGGKWQTDAQADCRARPRSKQTLPWAFLQATPEALGGTVFLGDPLVLRDGAICGDQGRCDFWFAPVTGRDRYFLRERFRNIHRYAGWAIELTRQWSLSLQTPPVALRHGTLPIDIRLDGLPAADVEGVDFDVWATVASKTEERFTRLAVEPAGQASPTSPWVRRYSCNLHEEFAVDDILDLSGRAVVRLKSGVTVPLETFRWLRLKDVGL